MIYCTPDKQPNHYTINVDEQPNHYTINVDQQPNHYTINVVSILLCLVH